MITNTNLAERVYILYPAFNRENKLEPYVLAVKESNCWVTKIIPIHYFNKRERFFIGLMRIFEAVVKERWFSTLSCKQWVEEWDYYDKKNVAFLNPPKVSRSIPLNYFFVWKILTEMEEKTLGDGRGTSMKWAEMLVVSLAAVYQGFYSHLEY